MNGNVRIFVSIPYSLLEKVERDVSGKNRDFKITKCIIKGFEQLTKTKYEATQPPTEQPRTQRG